MNNEGVLRLVVTVSGQGAAVTVSVAGEIDCANAEEMSAAMTAASEPDETRCVIADISGVDFMDSSGLSALITSKRSLEAAGVEFEVVGARGAPLRLLELSGVLDYLTSSSLEDDRRQAS
jgi:anti-sigma B factor antagonist